MFLEKFKKFFYFTTYMKTKYLCNACNYRFSRNDNPNVCPFCGKTAVQVDKPVLADDLLNEF